MLTNKELYGVDYVPPISKKDANIRIKMLRENLQRELDKPFKEQSSTRQYEILGAIKFWKKMSDQEDVGV